MMTIGLPKPEQQKSLGEIGAVAFGISYHGTTYTHNYPTERVRQADEACAQAVVDEVFRRLAANAAKLDMAATDAAIGRWEEGDTTDYMHFFINACREFIKGELKLSRFRCSL